jgi:holo-[acyl-carrier protein] synthase
LAGTGTDIVSVSRVSALIERGGRRFVQRWFTVGEIAYCEGLAVPERHFAARLAAKEAVLKAMPFAWDSALPWASIEVVRGASGTPTVRLSGPIATAACSAGVSRILVSLSHCDEYATAVALALATASPAPDERTAPSCRTSA